MFSKVRLTEKCVEFLTLSVHEGRSLLLFLFIASLSIGPVGLRKCRIGRRGSCMGNPVVLDLHLL